MSCFRRGSEKNDCQGMSAAMAPPATPAASPAPGKAASTGAAGRSYFGAIDAQPASTSEVARVSNRRFEGDINGFPGFGSVAAGRALGPAAEPLHEAAPGLHALAQMAALTTEMETERLRRWDLDLLASR